MTDTNKRLLRDFGGANFDQFRTVSTLPQPQPQSLESLLASSEDLFAFIYTLDIVPGRTYQSEIVEVPAVKTPNSKSYVPPTWLL